MSYFNTIYRGFDNPVIFIFTFTGDFAALGLNNFTSLEVTIRGETYSTVGGEVVVVSSTELQLNIGDSTELSKGIYYPTIVGYNATYDDGFVLSKDGNTVGAIAVI